MRRFLRGSGPLKRPSDRIQVLARVLLVALVLGAVPIALAVATATGSATRTVADAQSASRHRVTATLADDAAPPRGSAENAGLAADVTATWTAPSGLAREGVVVAAAGAKAGTTVTIWVDDRGDVTNPPLDGSDVVARALAYSLSTFLGMSTLAVLAYVGLTRVLERGRMRRWAAEWAVVEPVWSRKVP